MIFLAFIGFMTCVVVIVALFLGVIWLICETLDNGSEIIKIKKKLSELDKSG